MKPSERDALLVGISEDVGRLKEGTANIWRSTEAQEKHLAQINDHVADHARRLVVVETKVDERTVPKHKMSKKIITGYSGIILVFMTLMYYLGQARGWW